MPSIPGMETFKGSISHSTEFSNAKPNGHGKKAVVVGSSNPAQDIAQDFYEQGYDVTMFQRSSTLVLSSKFRNSVGLKGLYVENGPPIEDADLQDLSPSQFVKVAGYVDNRCVVTKATLLCFVIVEFLTAEVFEVGS
ncbi:hypothetical protein NM208_g10857 [Fusarium decemcellulare]|uniref:Uncharacterized protein n=1 Tax=Fusarium decemcellulare TaxID=57161 RepID=A0ACC1RWD5_9HYPO|nr:hypothetical protein NM208_g10857 [Fusarium decemcellulare]